MRRQDMLNRLDPKTRLRTWVTLQAGIEYVATVSFLALHWTLGTTELRIVLSFVAIAICNNALFLGVIVSGVSKRFKDPSMTALQMFASCGRDLLGICIAPELWYLFAFNLFIALPFGSLQFERRTFAMTWLLLCVGLGLAIVGLPVPLTLTFTTPADKVVLWVFLSAALARLLLFNARISDLRSKLRNKLAELDSARQKLARLATQDELTGLYNRREFNRRLAEECRRAERGEGRFVVAILDVDFFKRINDGYGHLAGDWVLQRLAMVLCGCLRQSDVVARFGGEEFALLLPGQDAASADRALHRLREAVARHPWAEKEPDLRVTVSVGAAEWCAGSVPDRLLQLADVALYAAKSHGRNRVEWPVQELRKPAADTQAAPAAAAALTPDNLPAH